MSEDSKTSVTVRIAGEEHTIRASVEAEYTRTCARLVDERIQAIRGRSGLLEAHKAAILAALSIADELLQCRDEMERLRLDISDRVTHLTKQLDSAASGPSDTVD